MDTNMMLIGFFILIVIVVITGFFVYPRRSKVDIRGLWGTGLRMEGSNDPPPGQPGVRGEHITSDAGGVTMQDRTGQGVEARQIQAQQDVTLTADTPTPPPPDPDPKA